MKDWKTTAILLCSYGLLKELQPSEFYLTEYLINHKNFTKETIVHEAFPLSTYTYFGALPFIFLFTDYLRYRPIIFLEAASFVITYALLIWSHGLFALKAIRIFHGIAGAAEIAYLTYIYAKVDKGHYKKVTSYTHCAVLVGTLIASIISQILVSFDIMNFHGLNYISLFGVSCALVLAAFLPSAKESMYFNRKQSIFPNSILNRNYLGNNAASQKKHGSSEKISSNELATISSSMKKQNSTTDNQSQIIVIHKTKVSKAERIGRACRYLLMHFTEAYSNIYVLKWSLWWAIAMAVHLQVVEYYELLWEEIAPEGHEHDVYNGGVNAVQCALSAIFALSVGLVQIHWFKWGETVLCLVSISQGIALVWMSQTNNIVIAYCLYIFYRTFYQVLITVASAEIAEKISEDSHGLIFGFNTFLAVCIETILTIIVSDKNGLSLDIRPEFLVYGCYYIILGFAFILVALYIFGKHGCIQLSWKVPKVEPEIMY